MSFRSLILLFCLIANPLEAAVEHFEFDTKHTLPLFEVNHLGFSTQRGRFDRAEGQIELDRDARRGKVLFKIHADSINMGSEAWNDKMRSSEFFDTQRFPAIVFESEQVLFEGTTPVAAEGTLTLLGVRKPVHLDIRGFNCGVHPILQKSLCAADIEARLQRSDFGMTHYLPQIGDAVRVLVPVEAFKQAP